MIAALAICCTLVGGAFGLKPEVDAVVVDRYPSASVSDFARRLQPMGRILELEEYYVWCCAPIYGPDEKVHVFYSRWKKQYGMGGWIGRCEIAHAVAERPEGPYTDLGAVIAPRPGMWDATTCHNPHIQLVGDTYYLFYMGTSDGSVFTKRIGLAKSRSLDGPWERSDKPLLETGSEGSWDDCCTTNPAFLLHPSGQAWLYYKSWNAAEYRDQSGAIRANRKYGLAVAPSIEGPYERRGQDPLIDLSSHGGNKQVEDAFIWIENGEYRMLMRDMGYFDHSVGLIFTSPDGLEWGAPQIAWFGAEAYLIEPPAPKHLSRYGRFERPQLLMKNGVPTHMFNAMQGGAHETSTGFVFKIN